MDTKEKLLEIALELIWQSNYNSVGVNEICRQAGVTKGAFYHHFESKASLFCEATQYYWDVIKTDLDTLFSPANSAIQQLENLIQYLFQTKLSEDNSTVQGCPFFNAGAQIGADDEKVIEALTVLSDTAIRYNSALIKSLESENYLEPINDHEQLARLVYYYIHGLLSSALFEEDITRIRSDLAEGLYRMLGLKKEHWYKSTATWTGEPAFLLKRQVN